MANATTRAKRLNETKMILRQPLLLIAIILSFALLLLFVIYPLAKTLIYSLTDETGAFSLANLITILQTPRYGKVFGRTMALGLIVAVIATFIGYVFAYTVTRVNVPAKGFFKTMATLPILSPPFVLSLSIIFLFGKQGLISKNLLGITGSSVYGLKSLIVVQVMSFFPIAYLTLSGILASIDASVEDAACNMGAGRWKTFWTVTFPLSLPGIISGALLVFIQSLEDFSNPATIGGDYTTLSSPLRSTTSSPAVMICERVPCWRFCCFCLRSSRIFSINTGSIKRALSQSPASPPRPGSSLRNPTSSGPCLLSA